MNDWSQIREHYRRHAVEIYEAGPRCWAIDPYAWRDLDLTMTLIEERFWFLNRSKGGLVLYPQYPVANHFVDFGNPVAKVAIECDGVGWHSAPDQLQRDAMRQREIEANGWIVYRIRGDECTDWGDTFKDRNGNYQCALAPPTELMKWIARAHGLRRSDRSFDADEEHATFFSKALAMRDLGMPADKFERLVALYQTWHDMVAQ